MEKNGKERNVLKGKECSAQPWINNTARWVKGGGQHFFSQIEPITDPCRTVTCQYNVERCWAGGLGQLFQYQRECNAESPKQDRKRFNSQGRGNTLPIWVYDLSMPLVVKT